MITPEQRERAAEAAQLWYDRHHEDGHRRHWQPDKGTGVEIHRIGMLGEFAFYNEFGGPEVDLTYRPGGDNGHDSYIDLRVPIDVKATTYTGPGQLLAVPVTRMHALTIYVAAVYDRQSDDIHLAGWEWGYQMMLENNVKTFGRHQTRNYVKPYRDCPPMKALKSLQRKPELVH